MMRCFIASGLSLVRDGSTLMVVTYQRVRGHNKVVGGWVPADKWEEWAWGCKVDTCMAVPRLPILCR